MPTMASAATLDDEWAEAGVLLDLLDAGRPAWWPLAACRTAPPAVSWFPAHGDRGEAAKAVCAACPARGDCLAWSLEQGAELCGIWAGVGERERRKMRRDGPPLSTPMSTQLRRARPSGPRQAKRRTVAQPS